MARMRLKHVGVVTVAFWHGVYTLIFALFIGTAYSIYTYLSYGRLPTYNLAFYMVGIPLVYTPLGFLAYGLMAIIYNSVAKKMGGIPLELSSDEYDAPPPPSYNSLLR